MTRYPIYLNYDPTILPVGWIEIDEDIIPAKIFPDIAVVPKHIKKSNEDNFRIVDFGLIQRTHVDTRPREELERST